MKAFVLACIVVGGCGDNREVADAQLIDATEFDAPPDANPLATLAGTGLCIDAGCTQISPDVTQYAPRFELWADGATKRRFMQLPPGTKIDTSDMDRWVFPVGTKFWKEFTSGTTRVETRFITKLKADDNETNAWFFVSYEWNAAQDATEARMQGVIDANGTTHDIPSRSQCKDCHDSLIPSRVLGFQAIQLDGAPMFNLEDLIAGDLLTAPPTGGTAGNRFPIPGSAVQKNALTYMHSNCGHCHNATSGTHDVTPMDVLLDTTKLASVATTPTFLTTVNVNAAMPFSDGGTDYTKIIDAGPAGTGNGSPSTSNLIFRTNATNFRRMPKVAVEIPDPAGQTALIAWINSL